MNSTFAPVTEVYATKKGTELEMFSFEPKKGDGQKRPGIIFFHGGGWKSGTPAMGYYWMDMAARDGFASFCPEYRLVGKNAETVADCMEDVLTAWCWVIDRAERWNLDVDRIFVSGGSAGGHLALMTAIHLVAEKQQPIPAGCLLFNPVVDTSTWPFFDSYPDLNPMERIIPGLPPMLILHGEKDEAVPIDSVRRYVALAKKAGIDAKLVSYPGQKHAFFNQGIASPEIANDLRIQVRGFLDKWSGQRA